MELPRGPLQRQLIQRYAGLLARLGDELGDRPLVLPDGDFFPDTFTGDARSAKRLVRRMRKHAGMSDIPVKTRILGAEPEQGESCGSGGCGTGGCAVPGPTSDARVVNEGDTWWVQLPAAELGHPVVLTTNVARSLAAIFLFETQEEGESLEEPVDATIDIAGVGLGFGVLLLSGSYIYQKSCGGPSVAQVTKLSCPELALLTALSAAAREQSLKSVAKHLETTQAALFKEARELVESNPKVVERLRAAPDRVAEVGATLEEARPWLLRALGLGGKKRLDDAVPDELSLDELESVLSAMPIERSAARRAPDASQDDLKALVAEALEEARSDAE